MFKINWGILDEEKRRISQIKHIDEFENNLNTIVGQFRIDINNITEGFVDTDIPYDGEFIVTWLQLLNDAIQYISLYSFASIYEPDTDNVWMEFSLEKNIIQVSQIRAEQQKYVEKFIEKTPRKPIKYYWCDRILKNEFQSTVLCVTKDFIDYILELNEIMSQSKEIKLLEEKYYNAKGIML